MDFGNLWKDVSDSQFSIPLKKKNESVTTLEWALLKGSTFALKLIFKMGSCINATALGVTCSMVTIWLPLFIAYGHLI